VTVIVGGVQVTGVPPMVALNVAAVPAVKSAAWVPFAWSVVAPIVPVLVPPLTVNTTVSAPVVRLFPLASLAWSGRVTVPRDATVPAETAIVDWLIETACGSGCT